MRAISESTTTAAGHVMRIRRPVDIVYVMVKITRDGDGHFGACRNYAFGEEFDVLAPLADLARVLDLRVADFNPPGFRRAQDDFIAGLEKLGLLVEIGVLRAIDVRLELYVEGPQPPALR